jgi:serine protease Do
MCVVRFVIAAVLVTTQAQAQQASPNDYLGQLSEALFALTARVAPAVVEIHIVGYGPDKDDDDDKNLFKQHASGSGVILNEQGYIITNAHVIKGAKRIRVIVSGANQGTNPTDVLEGGGARYDAIVLGANEDTDLAVLKIAAKGLPTLALADSTDLRQGQMVISVGNPLGMHNSVSLGVVSAVARQSSEDKPMVMIQTDAAVSPGSSGGALVDTQGRLVGITSQSIAGRRMGFAVPSNTVRFVYEQIVQHGSVHRGDIGVEVQSITPIMASAFRLSSANGVIVADVKAGSAAEKAGLKPLDLILAVDGKPTLSFAQFDTALYFKREGEQATLEVLRQGTRNTLRVPIKERISTPDQHAMLGNDPEKTLIPRLGIFGSDVNREMAVKDPSIRTVSGVMVVGLAPDLQDMDCDLIIDDIIHSVNSVRVVDLASLRRIVQAFKPGDAIALHVERRHRFLYVVFEAE